MRDLIVDRTVMFENLKKVHGWIENEGEGFGPKVTQERQQLMYVLSTCMTCGCCSESCPQINPSSKFIGPAPIAQVRLFDTHPSGEKDRAQRLRPLMLDGGISDCGNAQNCVEVCPKNLPLTECISAAGRDVTVQAFHDLFGRSDERK